MKINDILKLKIDGHKNIKGYLNDLLMTLWTEEEGFSGKRPFGNSGWQYDLYIPLIKANLIDGELDESGFLEECDDDAGYNIIVKCIKRIFK